MTIRHALLSTLLLLATFAQAQSSPDPQRILQEAVAAMGGAEALAGLKTITASGRAKHWAPGESFETGGPPRFVGTASFLCSQDLVQGRSRTDWNRTFEFPFPHPQGYIEVDGRRALGDGHRELVLYAVANPHAKNMLIGYVPDAGLCFVVDLWSRLRDTMPSDGQKALHEGIAKLGLKPALFVGGHGYSAPFFDLERLMAIPTVLPAASGAKTPR